MRLSRFLQPPSRRSLRQDLVHQLLLALFSGELRGGDRLVEEELAQRFQVSRTPVREALLELGVLGLVECRNNRGGVVREFGRRQLNELYAVRGVLEAEAARLATGKLPTETLGDLTGRLKRLTRAARRDEGWMVRSLELDAELHDLITVVCGNAMLAAEIRRYRRLVNAVREVLGADVGAQRRSMPQHLEILAALSAGDADKTAVLMRAHVLDCGSVAAERLFSAS